MRYKNPLCDKEDCWYKRRRRSKMDRVRSTSVMMTANADARLLEAYGISCSLPGRFHLCDACVLSVRSIAGRCHLCDVPMLGAWIDPLDGARVCAVCIPPQRISECAALGPDYDVLVQHTGSALFLVDINHNVSGVDCQSRLTRPWVEIQRALCDARVYLVMGACLARVAAAETEEYRARRALEVHGILHMYKQCDCLIFDAQAREVEPRTALAAEMASAYISNSKFNKTRPCPAPAEA